MKAKLNPRIIPPDNCNCSKICVNLESVIGIPKPYNGRSTATRFDLFLQRLGNVESGLAVSC